VNEFRLIVDPPIAGPQNMAIDECLLVEAAEAGLATLRFYQWNEPTLSLGYFQRYEDRFSHAASRDCAVVRRQTGGGAILHDRELTYSVVLPQSHPLARDSEQLYAAVHEVFIAELTPRLAAANSKLCLRRLAQRSTSPDGNEPFLCFHRRARGDVLLRPERSSDAHEPTMTADTSNTVKILGSAQRRRRGAILQHGSLLLERSPSAPELAGLCDMVRVSLSIGDWIDRLASRLAGALEFRLVAAQTPQVASFELQSKAAVLANSKYRSAAWTNRR
jgi:lipoate-protein ligase A